MWKHSQRKLFYLISHSSTDHFKEKNEEKFFMIDSTEEYEEVMSGINSKIRTLNDE